VNEVTLVNDRDKWEPEIVVKAGPEAGLMITQFIILMQTRFIWPCHYPVDGPLKLATPEEVMELKNEYIKMLNGN